MHRHQDTSVIGRVRAHLLRQDWAAAPRRDLDGALGDIRSLEDRIRDHAAELSQSVLTLKQTLQQLKRGHGGGGFRKAASLL